MTIEEKLVHDYGLTDDPMLAVWMLKDGRLVNGSYEGHQRDVDHREVSQYFKQSKFEDPGSALIYVRKFMNRGNIRYGCSSSGFCIEYSKAPEQEQFEAICRHMRMAEQHGIETCVGHYVKGRSTKYICFDEWLLHLARYVPAYARLFG